jgi:hypothetical protein
VFARKRSHQLDPRTRRTKGAAQDTPSPPHIPISPQIIGKYTRNDDTARRPVSSAVVAAESVPPPSRSSHLGTNFEPTEFSRIHGTARAILRRYHFFTVHIQSYTVRTQPHALQQRQRDG